MSQSPPLPAIEVQIQTEVSRRVQQYHAAKAIPPSVSADLAPVSSDMPPLAWGEVLTFCTDGSGLFCLREGWSVPERALVWTDGPSASLLLTLPNNNADALLTITAMPFTGLDGTQTITLLANGSAIALWHMTGAGRYAALIPASVRSASPLVRLTFQIANPISPAMKGAGADSRRLGLALHTLEATPF